MRSIVYKEYYLVLVKNNLPDFFLWIWIWIQKLKVPGITGLFFITPNPPHHLYSPFQDGESIPSCVLSNQASDNFDYSNVSAYTWYIA